MRIVFGAFGLLVQLFAGPLCPPDMTFATVGVCIDRLAFPNADDQGPMLGLSAVPEVYLRLDNVPWDAESLCASQGKRVCAWSEWQAACAGTVASTCPAVVSYVAPNWGLVAARSSTELLRLDQHAAPSAFPQCVGSTGARMMGNIQEWVRYGAGHAFSRSFWSRPGDCRAVNPAHAANWHDYATGTRCCKDL